MNNVTFNVTIIKDMINEGNESFTLIIVPESLPSRIDRGNPYKTTVTIVDIIGELLTTI